MKELDVKSIFDRIITIARDTSTCNKLTVGAGFLYNVNNIDVLLIDSNRNEDYRYSCKDNNECYKAKVTGVYESVEWTRKYCKSTHAEINLINKIKSTSINPENGILFVTRYPCENCALKCCEFGFKKVIYCGKQEISNTVKDIFNKYNVDIEWYPEIDYEYI